MAKKERTELERELDQYIDAHKQPGQSRSDFINETREGLTKMNQRALSTLLDLRNLIIKTVQADTVLNIADDFLKHFMFDAPDGNGVRWIKHVIKPGKAFEEDKFVPESVSTYGQKAHFTQFKLDNGNLAPNSVQWKWEITTQLPDLITYFKQGQLTEFLTQQVHAQLDQSIKVYIYHQLMTFIKNLQNIKVINGTATNTFDAITLELLPAINRMSLNTNEFNIDQTLTETIDASDKSNLLLIKNVKTDTILKSHIMSQLFNSQKIELSDYVGMQHISNHQFNLTADTVLAGPDYYCPEDEIWVIDVKESIKMPVFFYYNAKENYSRNVTEYHVSHMWFTIDALPWGKMFKYKNPNLNSSPAKP